MKGMCKRINICRYDYLCITIFALVNIGHSAEDPNITVSTNGSSLLQTTEEPEHSHSLLEEEMHALKCAQSSLVGPDYNKIFQPLPTDSIEAASHDKHAEPIIIRIIVDILRVMDVNEHEEVIVLLLTLKQFWTDTRLKPPPEFTDDCPNLNKLSNGPVRYLPEEATKAIWFPDVYLNRVEELHISKVLVNSDALRIDQFGNVSYTMFGKFKLSCEMNFRNFPLDVQYCPMYVESWRIRTTEQDLIWDPDNPIGLLSDYKIDQFSLHVVVLKINKVKYDTGSFARIGFMLVFSRKLPFYLLQIYFPTVLFVIISWLTFFIPPPYAQGRIILTITTLLALTALNSIISKHSPSASYLRGIDVWMQGCFLFVFVAIVDCLVDIRLLFVVSQSYKQENPSFLLPVSVALVENREVFDDLFGAEGDTDADDGPDATPSVYCDAPEPGPSMADIPVHGDLVSKRVSFAEPSPPATRALVSPQQLRAAESGPLQVPPATGGDVSERLEQRAIKFEKVSIVVYPIMFVLFNMCYWSYYLNASKPPTGVTHEITGGFIPEPKVMHDFSST